MTLVVLFFRFLTGDYKFFFLLFSTLSETFLQVKPNRSIIYIFNPQESTITAVQSSHVTDLRWCSIQTKSRMMFDAVNFQNRPRLPSPPHERVDFNLELI